MWVMTSFGILMPSIRPPESVPMGDNRALQIRSRREQDLDILREQYMGDALGPTMVTPDMDYNFRAYCTREAWGQALFDMAQDIDYEKFKPTTSRYNDTKLHSVYNSIWSSVCALNGPWGDFNWKKSKAAMAGNVLDIPAPKKKTYYAPAKPTSIPVKPSVADEAGFVEVAGPPKDAGQWDSDRLFSVSSGGNVQPMTNPYKGSAEFVDDEVSVEGFDTDEGTTVRVDPMVDPDFFNDILALDTADWECNLSDEERREVAAILLKGLDS